METEARLTTVHSRYHAGCSVCGMLDAFQTKADATARAFRHRHNDEPFTVTVFDSMHRRNLGNDGIVYSLAR